MPVFFEDLAEARDRWPDFTPRILELGMRSACAFPLRLRDDRIGALNLYRSEPRAYADHDMRLGQALADTAAGGILNQRAVFEAEHRARQLQRALDSRIVIEQAKGVVAERHELGLRNAFETLRRYARSHNRKLHDVCLDVIEGRLEL